MALGGLGIKLSDLTMLYAGLARGGNAVPLVERMADASAAAPRRLLDPVAAWYVGNILIGTPPPENAAGGRIAFKTGTSYGYRDAWSVGFDGKRTIGVWVGRPDGAPVPGLIGRTAAAPILFDAFARTGQAPVAAAARAEGRAVRRQRASCRRRCSTSARTASPGDSGEPPLRILFPPNGARVELATYDGKPDPLALKIAGGVEPLTVLVNGVPATARADRRTLFVEPGRAGLPAADGDRRQGRGRQRHGAAAIAWRQPVGVDARGLGFHRVRRPL